jgi:hypothetical protein
MRIDLPAVRRRLLLSLVLALPSISGGGFPVGAAQPRTPAPAEEEPLPSIH